MREQEKAKIGCRVPNGLTINLWRKAPGSPEGPFSPMVKDGAPVTLAGPSAADHGAGDTQGLASEPGITEVSAEWARAWFEQNRENNQFVAQGLIFLVEDEPPADSAAAD